MALGTDAAGALFVRSIRSVGDRLALIPFDREHNDARNELIGPVHLSTGDIRYLITPALEPHLRELIEDVDQNVSWIGSHLAKLGLTVSLFRAVAIASSKRRRWLDSDRNIRRSVVTAELWLSWWQATSEVSVRKELLSLLPLYPSVDVESELLECLDSPDLRQQSARLLGDYGAVRRHPAFAKYSSRKVEMMISGTRWQPPTHLGISMIRRQSHYWSPSRQRIQIRWQPATPS